MKIISGGQTGVDRAALDAALSLGVPCGGFCPAGRLDENGKIPPYYPVQELTDGGNLERTARNVSEADGTVIIHSGLLQGGTEKTADFCAEINKPSLLIDASQVSIDNGVARLEEFVRRDEISILNVAGPRASEWPQGYDFAHRILTTFLQRTTRGASPTLSFVVPAHNEEHELPETLRALRLAAESAGESYELVVVDDASTDATAEIAEQFSARIITINRRQIAAVRNAGARVAQGEILFFVDADTRITPGQVRLAIDALGTGCVGGSARVVLDGHLAFWARVFVRTFCAVYFAAGLGVGAFIFTRRKTFEEVGGFDEQYFAGEEVYLTLALRKLGRFKILREPIVTSARKMRMHPARFVFAQTFFILFGGKRALRKREKLSLWYDGKREQRATQAFGKVAQASSLQIE